MADEDDQVAQAAAALNAEMEALREKAKRFDALGDIPDRLEADPSKIYNLRAALEGRVDDPNQVHQRQQPPPQLTQEQINELNQQFWQNPAQMAAEIARQAAANQIGQAAQQFTPYTSATGDLFIDNFKSRKSSDPLFKTILPVFEQQIRDVNRTALLQMNEGARNRELNLRWDAAAAQVYRKAAESAEREKAPNMGGGSGTGAPTPPQTVFDKDPKTAALFNKFKGQGLLSDEDMAAILADIELENS
jgi:hypothetical protein